MKRGNLRVAKDHTTNLWHIQGRRNGRWLNTTDEDRKKLNLSEDIAFELKYDACGYLESFIQEVLEKGYVDKVEQIKSVQEILSKPNKPNKPKIAGDKKLKRKISNQSKRKNRKK